jgi:L-ascorbate metabolism protein UlaG (beta-lactamase superfamily)
VEEGKEVKNMKVTYLGTTTLLFDDGTDQVLFDCHISRPSIRACLFGRLSTDKSIADKVVDEFEINRLRAIFISHTHSHGDFHLENLLLDDTEETVIGDW